MNEKNLDYLKNQVKYSGFGETLDKNLEEQIKTEAPEFSISHKLSFGSDTADATLHFTKSKESDMYFFNSYQMEIKDGGEKLRQTFYMGRENNVTAKEAFNLLSGRSVFKEMTKMEKVGEGENARMKPTDEKYWAWKQLNFGQTDENGNFKQRLFFESHGFDLEKNLNGFNFKELEDNYDKMILAESLKKGNVTQVTSTKDGKDTKFFIEANPKEKTINVYDSNMRRLDAKNVQDLRVEVAGQSKNMKENIPSNKNDQKQNLTSDAKVPAQAEKQKKGLKV